MLENYNLRRRRSSTKLTMTIHFFSAVLLPYLFVRAVPFKYTDFNEKMNLKSGDGHAVVKHKDSFSFHCELRVIFSNHIVNACEAPHMTHVMYELKQ